MFYSLKGMLVTHWGAGTGFAALKAATRLLAWTRQVSLGWTKGSAFGNRKPFKKGLDPKLLPDAV